jgi:hypothetical protein
VADLNKPNPISKAKILLLFTLLLAVPSIVFAVPPVPAPPPAACDSTYVSQNIAIELSQSKACGNDTVGIVVAGIPNCNGKQVNVTFETATGTLLCPNEDVIGGQTTCFFFAPDVVGDNRKICANLKTDTGTYSDCTTELDLVARPPYQLCFNRLSAPIPCDESCTDAQVDRKWNNVSAVSLPLHFTFGVKEAGSVAYANLRNIANNTDVHGQISGTLLDCGPVSPQNCNCLTCDDLQRAGPNDVTKDVFGSPVWQSEGVYKCDATGPGNDVPIDSKYVPPNVFNETTGDPVITNAPEYPESGCKGLASCSTEPRNITRYKYEWEFSYDLIATAYSKTDYVPMFVGYDQLPVSGKAAQLSGSCVGDSICYTEVPLCGDDVCSVSSGENCNTCPEDCSKGPVPGFPGDCITNACTTCPSDDVTFADKRGCVISFKKEGDDCRCIDSQSECREPGKDLVCTNDIGIGGKELPSGEPGKCCPNHEVWNEQDGICEIPRKVTLEKVNFEFRELASFGYDNWLCCSGRADTKAIKVTYTFKNHGILAENITVSSHFTEEAGGDVCVGNECPFGGSRWRYTYGGQYALGQLALPAAPWIPPPGYANLTLQGSATETVEFFFTWGCARTDPNRCQRNAVGVHPENFTFKSGGPADLAPALLVNMWSVGHGPKPAAYYNIGDIGINAIDFFPTNPTTVICDTSTYACEKSSVSSGFKIDGQRFGAVCGGRWWGTGLGLGIDNKIPNPAPPWLPICCNTFTC